MTDINYEIVIADFDSDDETVFGAMIEVIARYFEGDEGSFYEPPTPEELELDFMIKSADGRLVPTPTWLEPYIQENLQEIETEVLKQIEYEKDQDALDRALESLEYDY